MVVFAAGRLKVPQQSGQVKQYRDSLAFRHTSSRTIDAVMPLPGHTGHDKALNDTISSSFSLLALLLAGVVAFFVIARYETGGKMG